MFLKNKNFKKGMTYIELIVVISIFTIMSGVAIYNQRGFQDQVNVNNLAQDIALQIVGQQKNAMFGRLPTVAQQNDIASVLGGTIWKPSYGVYVDTTTPDSVITFADADNNKKYLGATDGSGCPSGSLATDECLDQLKITGGIYITNICDYNEVTGCADLVGATGASVVFTRPDSNPIILDENGNNLDGLSITLSNRDQTIQKTIIVSGSGRISVENTIPSTPSNPGNSSSPVIPPSA